MNSLEQGKKIIKEIIDSLCPNSYNLRRKQTPMEPITTKPWGKFIPKLAEGDTPNQGEINSQRLYSEPEGLNTNKELPTISKSSFKKGVYY